MQEEDVALGGEGGARGEVVRLLREEKRLLEQEVAHLRGELRRGQVEQEHAHAQAAAALSEVKERVAVEEQKIEKCFKAGGVQQVLQYLYRFNPPRIKGSAKLFEMVMKKATPLSRILCAIQHYHPDQQGGNELVNGMLWTRFCVVVTALLNSYREQLSGGPRVHCD